MRRQISLNREQSHCNPSAIYMMKQPKYPKYKVGDFVHFTSGEDHLYGTITDLPNPTMDYYLVVVPDDAGNNAGDWGVTENAITLMARPQSTDHGAEEYNAIMSLQSTYPDGIT